MNLIIFLFAVFALAYIRNFAVPWLGGEGEKAITNMLWPGFEANWPLMITPDQAVFAGPEKDMSLATAYAAGGLGGVLGWLPLWNTVLLLTSSLTVHIAHLGLKNGNRKQFNLWLGIESEETRSALLKVREDGVEAIKESNKKLADS